MELHNADVPPTPVAGGLSRRQVMTGAGVALAGGLAAGVAGAAPAEAVDSGSIAAAQPGGTVLEFVCRITQNGLHMHGIGYLTQVAGLNDRDLFTDPAQRDESHARFVATATGTVVARSVDDKVTALDVDGALNVYYNPGGGASWSDETSFARGTQVAGYTLDLQDILTVIALQTGLPTLNGAALQVTTGTILGRRFGRNRLTLRFLATGLGTRSDNPPTASPQAILTVAGSMIAT